MNRVYDQMIGLSSWRVNVCAAVICRTATQRASIWGALGAAQSMHALYAKEETR